MAKTIIVCLDGTWNGPGETSDAGDPTPSNVQKLYERLAGTQALQSSECEAETEYAETDQSVTLVAKYIHGVGDASNILTKFAEGSTGAGLLARLVRGYTFVSRNWAPDDKIIIVGFSRGAYTARALAGLIVNQGLLDWQKMKLGKGGDPAAYAAGMTAWAQYRRANHDPSGSFIARIDDFVNLAKTSIMANVNHEPAPIYCENVPIKAIGVWDTVGAMGVPLFVSEDGTRPDLFQFVDKTLHPNVALGFHAIAADEERSDFTPTLWNARTGITQTLFPGAHADVGGGYPINARQTGLSNGALLWMLKQLQNIVSFKPYGDLQPDSGGVAHQPWLEAAYQVRPQSLRVFPTTLCISKTLLDRISAGAVIVEGARDSAYRPENLCPDYLDAESWKVRPDIGIDMLAPTSF